MKIFFYPVFLLCVLGCAAPIKDGIYKDYYENGNLKSVRSYDNGALNGIAREYYDVGTLQHAINYKNDQIDGLYNTYYPTGALWIQETYDHGVLVGRKEYDEEGKVIQEEGYSKE